ncbi:MAG: M23 family metallopeptidase [Desulfobacterales bacterium]|nr:M23 family metallopeptidase [Desulfobacterales bacterium]
MNREQAAAAPDSQPDKAAPAGRHRQPAGNPPGRWTEQIQSLGRRGRFSAPAAGIGPPNRLRTRRACLSFRLTVKSSACIGPYQAPAAQRSRPSAAASRSRPSRGEPVAGRAQRHSHLRRAGSRDTATSSSSTTESNFYTVYAHLEDVFKSVDNPVEAGEVVATVGDSGAHGDTRALF